MKLRILTIIILFFWGCFSGKPVTKEIWVKSEYDRAVAYYYEKGLFDEDFVIDRKLNSLIQDKEGILLSDKLIRRLNTILTSPDKYYGYPVMDCYLPRHGVVFWDKDIPVAWISVCFECGILKANPDVEKEELVELKSFFKGIGFNVE